MSRFTTSTHGAETLLRPRLWKDTLVEARIVRRPTPSHGAEVAVGGAYRTKTHGAEAKLVRRITKTAGVDSLLAVAAATVDLDHDVETSIRPDVPLALLDHGIDTSGSTSISTGSFTINPLKMTVLAVITEAAGGIAPFASVSTSITLVTGNPSISLEQRMTVLIIFDDGPMTLNITAPADAVTWAILEIDGVATDFVRETTFTSSGTGLIHDAVFATGGPVLEVRYETGDPGVTNHNAGAVDWVGLSTGTGLLDIAWNDSADGGGFTTDNAASSILALLPLARATVHGAEALLWRPTDHDVDAVLAPEASVVPFLAISDRFEGPSFDPQWTDFDGPPDHYEFTGGMVRLQEDDNYWESARAAGPWDFTNAMAQVEIPEINPDSNDNVDVNFYLGDWTVGFEIYNPGSGVTLFASGPGLWEQIAPYDAVAHRWLRLHSESGVLRWYTSPDGIEWTLGWIATVDTDLSALAFVQIGAGAGDPDEMPLWAYFDNLNVQPTVVDHEVDAYLVYTVAHDVDAVLEAPAGTTVDLSHGGDCVLKRSSSVAGSVVSLLRATTSLSQSTQALLSATRTKTHGADARLFSAGAGTGYAVDALLRARTTIAHAGDAVTLRTAVAAHTARALLRRTSVASQGTDAVLVARSAQSHATTSLLRATRTPVAGAEALLKRTSSTSHGAEGIARARALAAHGANALVRATAATSHSSTAILRARPAVSHGVEVQLSGAREHTVTARLVLRATPAHGAQALLLKTAALTHGAEVIKRRPRTIDLYTTGVADPATDLDAQSSWLGDGVGTTSEPEPEVTFTSDPGSSAEEVE